MLSYGSPIEQSTGIRDAGLTRQECLGAVVCAPGTLVLDLYVKQFSVIFY